jgi:glycerol-3-phosphate acyltransferase PlsY
MNDIFTLYNIGAIIVAYLLGSVPSSIWVGKWFFQNAEMLGTCTKSNPVDTILQTV